MRAKLALATTIAAMSATSLAFADTYVVRERAEVVHTDGYYYHHGVELGGYAGVGYGVGVGGRVGGTFEPGVYLGGAFTFYSGNASFVGGELGYKFWPGYRWELRPYVLWARLSCVSAMRASVVAPTSPMWCSHSSRASSRPIILVRRTSPWKDARM